MIQAICLGAGGHARVVIDILQQTGSVEIVGLLTPDKCQFGKKVLGIPVLGDDTMLSELYEQGVRHAFLGVGSVERSELRCRLYEMIVQSGYKPVTAIHPAATIARSASLGHGLTIMAGAVVGVGAHLGDNVIVNSAAVVEHDCEIGDHAHISPGVRLAGGVRVGRRSHVGIGACVIENKNIGSGSTVGAGAVVVNDVPDNVVVMGIPARILRAYAP